MLDVHGASDEGAEDAAPCADDGFCYAPAERADQPLLFKDEDLPTDIKRALEHLAGLPRRLAEDVRDAARLRAALRQTTSGEPPKIGGILTALRRSPLVGAKLDLTRSREEGRAIDL